MKYSIENLNKLPKDLTPYKASQRTTDSCLIFHGQHTPLSNYHLSPFAIEGHKLHSAEQFIQFKKACHFNDYVTADKIKACKQAGDAKTLSWNIQNYSKESWNMVAKDTCFSGIRAKFTQNPLLLKFLQSTTPLTLAESSYDKLWGTGLSLYDTNVLKQTHWANLGILGEILSQIRKENTPPVE